MEGGFLAGAPGRSECSRDFFLCRGRRSILPQHLLHDLFDHGGFYGWRLDHRGRALPAVGRHRTGQKDSFAPPRWSRPWRCRRSCPKAGGKMGKRNPRGKPLGFWRSIRDLNSGGAVNALSHFESFPPCDFWWKLSEDGSTQRKPKSCGILRILASVFRFYLNPQGFPSSSHFCPEL